MRIVVQRVASARVETDEGIVASIGRGILVLAAFRRGDSGEQLDWMARKCLEVRIFEDAEGKMNRSVLEEEGEVLVVSQFTLYGDCRKGRRPSYINAASPDDAEKKYQDFVTIVRRILPGVQTGKFQAMMEVSLTNDGPVTLILDSAQ